MAINKTSQQLFKEIKKNEEEMKWVVFRYMQDANESKLREWLKNHKPSKTHLKDNFCWISIRHPRPEVIDEGLKDNLEDEDEDPYDLWQELDEHQQTEEKVLEIARRVGERGGKWLIMVPKPLVDQVWGKVATGIFHKRLGANTYCAKVSTNDENQEKHVICIYTPDILNREDIYECEGHLRRILLLYSDSNDFNILTYKPDICTLIGIYKGHKIRPTMYTSRYDHRTRKSNITLSQGFANYLNN